MAGIFPKGYLFRPTDQELIQYLTWKILGVYIPLYTINKDVENIYACHPRDFDWTHVSYYKDYERYFFSKRVKVSKNSNGKRCKRELEISEESDGGFWKASTKETKILDYESKIIGYVRLLKFHAYKNKNRIRKEAQPTEWIMHEYRLHGDTFQEWVVCRIKNKIIEAKKHGSSMQEQQQEHGLNKTLIENNNTTIINKNTLQDPELDANYVSHSDIMSALGIPLL